MRKRSVLVALVAVMGAAGAAPATASGFVARWYQDKVAYFSGDDCGSVSTVREYLPLKAFRISAERPKLGATFRDEVTEQPVARLTGIKTSRSGRPTVAFIATGSDDACGPVDPNGIYDRSWITRDIRFRVDYSTRERVYVPDSGLKALYKPRRIVFGASQRIDKLRWTSWGGQTARGWGAYPYNDCVPYCAAGHITWYRIRAVLSKRRLCNGRYQYLRIGWRFIGQVPPHSRRSQHTSMSWVCE